MENETEARESQSRLRQAEAVDAICDSFETAWRSGDVPNLGQFLTEGRAAEETRVPIETLFRELILIDVEYRRRRGETVSSQAYVHRFPELESVILETFSYVETLPAPDAGQGRLHPMLGRFELLERLGEGSFGVVWKARDLRMKRIVALKQFRGLMSRGNWEIVEREAQAAARLDHANIARVLEVSESMADPYIVFEFVDGQSLKARLENEPTGRFPPRDAVRWMTHVARGLAHIHAQGLIHRDLKPANIILSGEGIPKIVDFGLARRVDAESSLSNGKSLIGTLPYMSPEQCLCRPIDVRTDIYSLGVVLYELLAGHRPYDGTAEHVLSRIPKGDPPPLSTPDGNPAVLERICRKAMEVHCNRRYQTAAAMADDLERYLQGEKVSAGRGIPRLGRRSFLVATSLASAAYYHWRSNLLPAGWQNVTITTRPAGAKVVFIPFSRPLAKPLPGDAFVAPTLSPTRLPLPAGDYLVVALLDDGRGRFHEVLRHVPVDATIMQGVYAFQRWTKGADGSVALADIRIPDEDVISEMSRIPRADFLTNNRKPGDAAVQCLVPEFLVDRHAFTIADYKRTCLQRFGPGEMPYNAHVASGAADDLAVNVSYEEAVARAEDAGKRLLHEWEFELLAGSAKGATSDGEKTDPGAASVKALWVESYLLPHSELWNSGGVPRTDHRALRMAREERDSRVTFPGDNSRSDNAAHGRLLLPAYATRPGVGFRCARSETPRLTADDFPRLAEAGQK